jgi:hypothetical protein
MGHTPVTVDIIGTNLQPNRGQSSRQPVEKRSFSPSNLEKTPDHGQNCGKISLRSSVVVLGFVGVGAFRGSRVISPRQIGVACLNFVTLKPQQEFFPHLLQWIGSLDSEMIMSYCRYISPAKNKMDDRSGTFGN